MPSPSDRPIRKVTLNLYIEDIEAFEARYGRGWTEQIRLLVHKNCEDHRRYQQEIRDHYNE